MIKFYGYKKCGTCAKAMKFLSLAGIVFEFVDITISPPSANELAEVAKKAAIPLSKLFNTSGLQYRDLKIKDKVTALAEQEILDLLANNGRLINRPVVTDGMNATIGFSEKVFAEVWIPKG